VESEVLMDAMTILMFIGTGLIVGGFVLFLVAEHFERQAEIKLFKLEQAFNNAKEREKQNAK
jgi:hypothetical protein